MHRRLNSSRPLVSIDHELEHTLTQLRRQARERGEDPLQEEVRSSPTPSSPNSSEESESPTGSNPNPFANNHNQQSMGDQGNVGDQRSLKQLGALDPYTSQSGILAPTTQANNFEIKPNFISLIEKRQFTGGKFENPHEHFKEFLKYCDTIKINGVTQEYIQLKMFPFSLIGVAEHWLNNDVPPGSLTTWNEVTTAFLARFYNHKKIVEARSKIQSFRQRGGESLCEAWERYKELQRQCPHHGIPNYQILQTFYGGLSPQSKTSLDAGAGGPIMSKREDEVESIIEDVVRNYEDWYEGEREATSSKGTVQSIEQTNAITNLSNQMAKMAKQMEELMKSSTQNTSSPSTKRGHGMNPSTSSPSNYNAMPPGCMFCDICGNYDHNSEQCMSINEYQSPSQENDDDNVEDVNAMNFVPREGNVGMRPNWNQNQNRGWKQNQGWNQNQWNQSGGSYDNQGQAFIKNQESYNKSQEEEKKQIKAHMKMLETQISQIAQLSSSSSPSSSSSLPSQGVNPKSMYAITTRSGKILESDLNVEKSSDKGIGLEVEDESSREGEVLEGSAEKHERGEREKEKEPEKESTKEQTPLPLNLQPRNERLPFPQRFARSKLDTQFGKFLEVVKGLHISIPFVDAMKEMPHYSKFLKDLLNGKRGVETVNLTANCSAILSSKLPTKLQDPGSFSIPCSINEIHLGKALCDLGASVSLMSSRSTKSSMWEAFHLQTSLSN
ncbi:uncharacterized protein LOC110703502 [Chenopodium quinoa]|uniref:uncharacterized protein LOC110703502 n=1 Tax=Chenopodium quinoa TaxID=63459 RepID=UPI000B77CD76|nr:uncharacterized protein LOC110703502 [Chenopodium quinoa]